MVTHKRYLSILTLFYLTAMPACAQIPPPAVPAGTTPVSTTPPAHPAPTKPVQRPRPKPTIPVIPLAPANPHPFSYTVPKDVRTSAGVFDSSGNLVRILWSLRMDAAGQHDAVWDGRDELGQAAPEGNYTYKVVWSSGEYRNVGAVGNTAEMPTAQAHTPSSMLAVSVDASGNVYTVNGWDEAGADFKKWSSDGKSVYDAHFRIRNGIPNGMAYSLATDDTYLYCGTHAWANKQGQERQQVRRFRLDDGKLAPFTGPTADHGNITLMDWPSQSISPEITGHEREIRLRAVSALAVSGNTLFVGDAFHDQIIKMNKETGETIGTIPCRLPKAFAVDTAGTLWVGYDRTKLGRIATPLSEKATLTVVRDDIGEIEGTAFSPSGNIFVVDRLAGQVKIFSADGKQFIRTFGQLAQPGDYVPDHFYSLRSVAVAQNGDFITVQVLPGTGSRLTRWSADGKMLWDKVGAEFVSLGAYNREHPDTLYTFPQHRYLLKDRTKGEWEYRGSLRTSTLDFNRSPHGTPKILTLHNQEFAFFPAGDGVRVYRIEANSFHFCSCIGGGDPGPDGVVNRDITSGQWSWHDINNTGNITPAEVTWSYRNEKRPFSFYGLDVDNNGTIWIANRATRSVCKLPIQSWDQRGNPVYDWTTSQEVIPTDTSLLHSEIVRAVSTEDGSVYVLAKSKSWNVGRNILWMGGYGLLIYDREGHRRAAFQLPEICVGMDSIPGSTGIMLAGGKSAMVYHYSADGLLLNTVKPGPAVGSITPLLDNFACLSVNRYPGDKLLDVFTEDDFIGRIVWYRIDDHQIGNVTGKIP